MCSKRLLDSAEDTITRVLSAAELVFAEKGHDKASLREITARANVNLAAVNYHFRSKDGLVTAVFENLSSRVNKTRVKELEQYIESVRSAGAPPDITIILDIFIRPYVQDDNDHRGVLLARLILQHRISPSELTHRIIKKHFDPMAKKFVAALSLTYPALNTAELYWRYTFMVSTVVLTMTDTTNDNRLARLSKGVVDMRDKAFLRAALLRFLVGGLAAPTK